MRNWSERGASGVQILSQGLPGVLDLYATDRSAVSHNSHCVRPKGAERRLRTGS
jgi:hypothetical protein